MELPLSEIEFSYARSSGPGGQNVNKVNSKAVLRWNIATSAVLLDETRARLLSKLAARLTTEGEIVIASDRFRDQGRNREDCLEKLHALISQAMIREKPRKKTKPSRSSQRRTQETKKRNSEKKGMRQRIRY